MIEIGGLFFPDGEKHFAEYGDQVGAYQQRDRDAVYAYVKRWRRVLDVGANVGIFARDFAGRFDEVVAFEPMPSVRECLARNVPSNVRIEPFAISDQPGVLEMHPRGDNCGMAFVSNHPDIVTGQGLQLDPSAAVRVEARTLDSFEFDAVDLIKLDIEGGEYPALLGARETILKHRPVIMVEDKPVNEAHREYMKKVSRLLRKSLGMTQKEMAQSDRIYVFED